MRHLTFANQCSVAKQRIRIRRLGDIHSQIVLGTFKRFLRCAANDSPACQMIDY